jgi:hypothetical protein
MGGPPFPEIPCNICRKSVDLTVDLCSDEEGNPVHVDCYVKALLALEAMCLPLYVAD